MIDRLSLAQRLWILLFNFTISYLIFVLSVGYFLPKGGLDVTWLLSATSFWFLTLLSAPWFVPPRDSLISGVGACILLLSMSFQADTEMSASWMIMRWGALMYCLAVVVMSAATIATADQSNSGASRTLYRLTSSFGTGQILFSFPAVLAILVFHRESGITTAWLLIFWLVFVLGKVTENVVKTYVLFRSGDDEKSNVEVVGAIYRIDHPNIIRVKIKEKSKWPAHAVFAATAGDGVTFECLALYSQRLGDQLIGTGILISEIDSDIPLPHGAVAKIENLRVADQITEELCGEKGCAIAGFVVENSSISTIKFEVSASSTLSQGDVVFGVINQRRVYFQIVDAETREESFDANPYGKQVAVAAQLGCFETKAGFVKFDWLPEMNSPLFRKSSESNAAESSNTDNQFVLGKVPSTSLPVWGDIGSMVDHHTAVLGATGTGKTEVALDIARTAIEAGVKVFCVDFTGEYIHRLSSHNPQPIGPSSEEATELGDRLFDVDAGEFKAGKEKRALEQALNALRDGTKKQVSDFLESPKQNLAIFELSDITNNQASLRITEMYLSEIMRWSRENRGKQKVLIVLEEAHTIVPETGGSGFDFNTQWVVSRIGQIALQGRKYGVGLLVITQRTALVSKTILSQCNTFLTHALIDQTSLGFLTNVYGAEHCKLIPNLRRFEFLGFGKGLSSERPILLKRDFDPAKKAESEKLNHMPAGAASKKKETFAQTPAASDFVARVATENSVPDDPDSDYDPVEWDDLEGKL